MSLNFKITGDNSDLAKKCSESTRLLNETAKKGEKAGKDLAKAYEEAAQSVKIIENDIKSLEKQLEKVAPGKQKLELTAELNAAKKTLMEEKGALAELDSQLNLSGQAHVAMRTEIRNLKEQMSSMTEGTDEYRAALQRLGDLQDRMGDINQQGRIFADDNKNIKATMEAVSGLTGAMTAGVGTLSLFGMKSEQLAAIQTRLQAVMAITMGVQQVANVLNKDSYLSHILLVKAKDLLAAANLKLATTFHISNAAAQALMATLTLGLSAAITALIVVWQKFSSAAEREQEKLTDSIEQTRSQLQGMSDDIDFDVRVAEAAGKARSELIELRREAAKTALALADMKFDEINTKYLSGEATKEQWQSAKDMADEAFKALNKVNQDAVIAEIKDQKDLEKAQKEGNQKLLDEKQKNANDLLAAEEAAQQKINAVTIALMQEGCEKRKRLAQQQFNDEISRIDKEEQEKLLKAATPQEEQTIKNQSSSLRALATQQLMNTMFSIESQAAQERQKIREDEEQSWINYNKKFGNYQEQREAIIQDYNRKIANATTGGDKALLNKEMEQSLDELDRRMQNSATSMAQFFQESAEMSVAQIDKILNKAQSLMDYLSGTGSLSREQVISLGISEADLKNLENNADQVEALSNAIKRMRNELGSRSPFLLFKNQIQGAAEAFKNGDTAAGIEGIGNAITQFTPAIERLGNDLGNIFGSSDIADKIGGITDGLAGMGQAAAGVGQMMSGDIVGGAMAAVSGISQVVTAFEGLFGANYDKYNKAKEEIGRASCRERVYVLG